ncbi:MAG TPA: serpin family protein [Polyangiales bacterium]|nr:serpin family protein [Polyangiales bacterium]
MSRVMVTTFALAAFACGGTDGMKPEAVMPTAGAEAPAQPTQPPAATAGSAPIEKPAAAAGTSAPKPPAQAGKGGTAGAAGAMAGAAGAAGSKTTPPPATGDMGLQRSSVAANSAPSIADSDYASFISHINKFGLDLGQQVAGGEYKQSNLIYSPLSATIALSMTYAGAKGQTASEMKSVLGDTFAAGVFHTANNRLARELASRVTSRPMSGGNEHKIELNIADSIFVDRSVTLQAPFLEVLGREYDSGVRTVDFIHAYEPARMGINAWVEEQTKDKIQDLLPMGSIDQATRLVLVNALYFYGSWLTPFVSGYTHDAAFKTLAGASVQVPTMNGGLRLQYRAGDKFALAELPYEGEKLRMTIVLPAAGEFETIRAQVSAAWLEQAVSNLSPTLLNVSLPKFKMTVGSFRLTDGLKALGMKQAFTDSADLSGIATGIPLSISDVVQKAFIAVDENGTEAAAATGVIVGTTSAPVDQPIPFTVDRPFLFFIRDANGAVLFSGHVVDPSK